MMSKWKSVFIRFERVLRKAWRTRCDFSRPIKIV